MPYGPAELGIAANEAKARAYGTAGLDEELARNARVTNAQTRDPQQQAGSAPQAPQSPDAVDRNAPPPTNPGPPMTEPTTRTNTLQTIPQRKPSTDLPGLEIAPTPTTTLRDQQQVGGYVQDIANTAGSTFKGGADAIRKILAGEDVGPNIIAAGGSALGLLGLPFLYTGGEVVQTGIEANPLMRDRFHQELAKYGIEPGDNSHPSVRIAIADQVLKEFENAAHDAASDKTVDHNTQMSAAIVSGLIKAEQFAELGGPQGALALRNLTAHMTGRAAGLNAPKSLLDEPPTAVSLDELTARTGGKGAPSTAESRTITDTSPEAEAARIAINKLAQERADSLLVGDAKAAAAAEEKITSAVGEQIANQAEANRLRLEAIQAPVAELHESAAKVGDTASGTGVSLGPIFDRAIKTADEAVAKMAIKGGTQGIPLNDLDEVIAKLEASAERAGRTVPAAIIDPLRDLRATLWDQTLAEQGRQLKSVSEEYNLGRRAATASKAETAASRGQFAAARRMANAQAELEAVAGRLGQATQDAQVVATRRLAEKAKAVGREMNAADQGVAGAAKAGDQAAQQINDAFEASKTKFVETGDAFRTDVQNRAFKMVTNLANRAEKVRASLSQESSTMRLRSGARGVETGYMTPDDALVWDKARIHTGKQDDPLVRSAMADFYRQHGAEVESELRHLTWDHVIGDISRDLGIDAEKFGKTLPKTAEVTRRMYIAQQVLGVMTRDWQAAARDLAEGRITSEAFDAISGKLISFSRSVSGGISELGRALGAQRIIKSEVNATLVQTSELVTRRRATLEGLTSKIDDYTRQATQALEFADQTAKLSDAHTASLVAAAEEGRAAAQQVAKAVTEAERNTANAAVDQVAKKIEALQAERAKIQNASSTRVRETQARMEQHLEAVDSARAEYDAAVKMAADAAMEAHNAYVARSIRMGATPEQLRVLGQIEPENVQGILHFMRDLVPVKKGSVLQAYLLNNTYGSIPGLLNNLVNTGLHELFQKVIVNPIAEGVRAPLRREFGEPVFVRGETRAQFAGTFAAIPDATTLFMKTLLNGEAPEIALKHGMLGLTEESGMKFGTGPRPVIQGPKGLIIENSLRILGGSDGFWRILDGGGEANALMLRDAVAAGRDSEAVANLVKFKTQPSSEQLARASTVTLRNTFNDPAKVGGFTQRMLHLLNTDINGFAPGRVLVPAARFGIASAKHAVSLTPVGMVRGAAKLREAKGMEVGSAERINLAREGARQYIEGSLGSMMIVASNHAYDAGLITGAYPTNKQEQAAWALEKRQPMSVMIGGQWVPYSFFGPLAAPFMFTALIRDQQSQMTDATIADHVERAAMGIGRYMTDIPAFSATYRLMDTIYAGVRFGYQTATDKFLAGQITKAIPASATLNSLVPVWDPTERDPNGIIERLMGRIPIISRQVPSAITPEGTTKQRPVSGTQSLLGAGGAEPTSLTGAESALAEGDKTLMPIGNKIGTVDLTRDQFRRYQSVAGPMSTQAIDKLIASDEYKNEKDPLVRQHLRDVAVDKSRTDARKQVATEFLKDARTEDEVTKAATMVRSTSTARELAYTLQALRTDGRLTPAVTAELDRTRGFQQGTDRDPTVGEMLIAAPRVQNYLAIPPYRSGNADEWQRLKEARAAESKIRADDPKKADAFHNANALLRKYDNTALVNPARAAYRAAHPEILPYIAGTGYTHEP